MLAKIKVESLFYRDPSMETPIIFRVHFPVLEKKKKKKKKKVKKECSRTAGFEPAISWSVVKRLIHWATLPHLPLNPHCNLLINWTSLTILIINLHSFHYRTRQRWRSSGKGKRAWSAKRKILPEPRQQKISNGQGDWKLLAENRKTENGNRKNGKTENGGTEKMEL